MKNKEILDEITKSFSEKSGLMGLDYEDVTKGEKDVRVIYISNPTDRLYSILNNSIKEHAEEYDVHVTLKNRSKPAIVSSSEARLLIKVLSDIQNVNQHSFDDDFFDRYTHSVTGAENQIISYANHVVTGRRGAGKSMLLLYAFKTREKNKLPNSWIDIQAYSGRDDEQAVVDVVLDLLYATDFPSEISGDALVLRHSLESTPMTVKDLRKFAPRIRRLFSRVTQKSELFVFLDDLHVFNRKMQYLLLDVLYSFFRGNKVYIKASAIETLLQSYNSTMQLGMQIPQDIQRLGLDYNLTTPDKAAAHIESILDAHARYSGLPSIRRLSSSADVLPRLTWVSAGVPRDAINLFSQSILKAIAAGKPRVTVSNVNMAASDNLSIKLKDLQTDASSEAQVLTDRLEEIRNFCILVVKSNAFLIENNQSNDAFKQALQLVQLRLLHVVSEGITPKEAGKKFMALMLDYGLYTGVRATASVELFNKEAASVSAKDLRKLPIFKT